MKAAEVKNEFVRDWMRPEMASVQVDASLEEAVSRMNKLSLHHLIVMDGKNYQGVLDARDCAGEWDKNKKVSQIMRTDVPAVDESTEIRTVVHLLVGRGLTAVPLTRLGRVEGILTATDLLRLLEAELAKHNEAFDLLEKGKDFLTRPIVQSLSNTLGNAGL